MVDLDVGDVLLLALCIANLILAILNHNIHSSLGWLMCVIIIIKNG